MKKTFNAAPPNAFLKLEIPGEREDCLLSVSSIAIPQKYVTVLSAAQASIMASEPPVLNLPAGRYIFLGGSIESKAIQANLILGNESDISIVDENSSVLSKTSVGVTPLTPGGIQMLSPYVAVPITPPSGKYSLIVIDDNPTALDGPIKITLLVVPL